MNTESQTFPYIETPRRSTSPMKLERILKRRMRAFIRARHQAMDI